MEKNQFKIRRAKVEDAIDVAAIYNDGIDERSATFNTNMLLRKKCRRRLQRAETSILSS
ncbi:hypothetical protein MUP38_06595 [Candidatus Bathyarchaeota archaeon]|nr:hypothetical protein [Candidatus Bathyarchaeota archaeon]